MSYRKVGKTYLLTRTTVDKKLGDVFFHQKERGVKAFEKAIKDPALTHAALYEGYRWVGPTKDQKFNAGPFRTIRTKYRPKLEST